MSKHNFIECLSSDPYIRSLGRQVNRLMNDPTLGLIQKQRLVMQVQERLMAYQAKQMVKAPQKASQHKQRETSSRSAGQVLADPKGLSARRKEFRVIEGSVKGPTINPEPQPTIAANDGQVAGRRRPLLTLKRA